MKFRVLAPVVGMVLLCACGNSEEGNTTNNNAPISKGQQLFNTYCLQCHSLDKDKMGPALKGAIKHWDNDTARIAAYIRDAEETIANGDPRAVEVAEEWNHAMMPPMPQLSDEEINAILEYIAE